jgi:MoaA/NifB/PqqE/SkfB family radical SAM enzyme
MLKVQYEPRGEALHFALDTPIAPACADHPELRPLLGSWQDGNGAKVLRDGRGAITGLTMGLAGWRRLIRRLLPPREAEFQRAVLDRLLGSLEPPQGPGLQVNFHQKSFDTAERYWSFLLAQGHFPAHFFNRINWYLAPANRIVTPFPLHVDLESASTCNMDCPMCYRRGLKHTGHMDLELFRRAVDECAAEGVFSLRLSWRGETLTHPRIQEMIAYAAARVPNVSFLTNAFYLDDEVIDCLVESRVSYVAVSFDGYGETYERIRKPARFADSYRRLERLLERRRQAGSRLPQVRLCTIWPAIKDDPGGYYRTMSRVSDYIVVNPYINFQGPMTVKPDFICQYPWERLVVGYDGQTQCCTGWNAEDIVLGDAARQSLKEMWHSPLLEAVRALHAAGRRLELGSCAACRHGSQGDPDITIDEILARRH